MADELRRLIADGAAPGWVLHRVPGGRTPLHMLAAPGLWTADPGRAAGSAARLTGPPFATL